MLSQTRLQKPQITFLPHMRWVASNWQSGTFLKTNIPLYPQTILADLLKDRALFGYDIARVKNMILALLHKTPLSPWTGLGVKSCKSLNG